MKNEIFVSLFLILIGGCNCRENKIDLVENNLTNLDTISTLDYNDNTWHNSIAVERDINILYNYIKKMKPKEGFDLKNYVQNIPVPVECVVAHSVKDSTVLLDELVIMFFLKTYKNNLLGNDYLKNVSCCYVQEPFLLLFVQHFYKISGYDPTIGLFTEDIYLWAKSQKKILEHPELKHLL